MCSWTCYVSQLFPFTSKSNPSVQFHMPIKRFSKPASFLKRRVYHGCNKKKIWFLIVSITHVLMHNPLFTGYNSFISQMVCHLCWLIIIITIINNNNKKKITIITTCKKSILRHKEFIYHTLTSGVPCT